MKKTYFIAILLISSVLYAQQPPMVKISGPTELCEGRDAYLIPIAVYSKFVEHNWSGKKKDGTPITPYTGSPLHINGPGTYYLMSKDTNDCYAYDTFTVTSLKPIFQNLNITHVDCYGNAAGQFSCRMGHGYFKEARWIIWDNTNEVMKDSNILHLLGSGELLFFQEQIAGDYYFYGKDIEECDIETMITIEQPDSLYFSAITKAATCLEDNGEIDFEVIGGTSPYNILINETTNVQANKITDLPAGVYIAKIEDKNNCVAFDTALIEAEPFTQVDSILILNKTITININQDTVLSVVFSPQNTCNQDVVWHSKDANIATVSASGKIIGVFHGETYIVATSDDGGFQDSCKITVSDVGINNYELRITNYVIYPNPTTGQLIINNEQLTMNNVELFDIYGKRHELRVTCNEFDISHLAKGMYYLRIAGEESRVIKIIKK